MGGVDRNDQLLKYSTFNKRSVKWWKKLFRLLNIGMVNAYICYKEWLSQHSTRRINQTDFRTLPIKWLTALIISVLQREELTLTLNV